MKLAPSRWLFLIAGWTLFGALQALLPTVQRSQLGGPGALPQLLAFHLPLAWIWVLFTPVVGLWSRVVASRWSNVALQLASHLPLVVVIALAHTWFRRELLRWLGSPPAVGFDTTLLFYADLTIVAYVVAAWASRTLEIDAALLRQERRTIELRRQLSSARLEYLGMQLRPHFLFNALGSVSELAREAPANAARMLLNVVALLESAIRIQGKGLVTLGSELEALEPYLEIQRLRFSDWLSIDVDAALGARAALVPPLILQPLVENAVHHGLIRRSARGAISVRAAVVAERLHLSISDNGQGLAASSAESRGLGLTNLRARLNAVYGDDATLELRNAEGGGVDARLDLPLRAQPDAGSVAIEPELPVSRAPSPWTQWVVQRPVTSAIAAWTVVALLRVQHSYAYMMLRDRFSYDALWTAIRYDVTIAGLWLLMTPVPLWLARKVPVRRATVARSVAVHVGVAALLAYLHATLVEAIVTGAFGPAWTGLSNQVYAWNVAIYGVLAVAAHQRALEEWLRERALAADKLRRDIDEARFNQLAADVSPQVLIDALRRLARQVETNPAETETALADVADLLRRSLDVTQEAVLTLQEESELVRAYARVLRIASVPELTFELRMADSMQEQQVTKGALRRALDSALERNAQAIVMNVDAAGNGEGIRVRISPAA